MPKKEKIGYKPTSTAETRDIAAWFIILLVAIPFCFPVAIYLAWKRTAWKRWVKILFTAVVLLFFVTRLVSVSLASGNGTGNETTAAVETVETVS